MGNFFFDRDLGYDKLLTTFDLNEKESYVQVGFGRSSGMHKEGDISVAALGAVHEFGSKDGTIPERSFMRSSMDANKEKLKLMIDKIAAKVADGDLMRDQGLGIIGQFLKDRMVSKINSGLKPPLKPATIARKGSSKPLIDTGQLKNAIEWEIKKP